MKFRTGMVAVFALLAFVYATSVAASGGRADVRKTMESSMLVTGSIDIDKDGSVGGYLLDQPEKLPPAVLTLMEKAVPHWRFEPVEIDGEVVKARSKMGVRVIARRTGEDSYQLRVGGASFGESDSKEMAKRMIAGKKKVLDPPSYPAQAVASNVSGMVYLLVKIDSEGDVEDAFAEQINLTVLGNEKQMIAAREMLTKPSISHAKRRWKFTPPTPEALGDDGYSVVRVPISYQLRRAEEPGYGEWSVYIPGPRQRPEWAPDEDDNQSPDAMIAGQTYAVGQGPKLLTSLSEG